MEKAKDRLEVLEKMEKLESQGIFDIDVENDPPSLELFPKDIDYLHKKLKTKILTHLTLKAGEKFFQNQISLGNLLIKQVIGEENLLDKKQGAIVTCNHFSPFDNYLILTGVRKSLKKARLYKVIREGNYTNPPKGFEMFMRYGDTLPLSRNRETMRKFLKAINILLKRGEKIVVYPEQAMWWNYRKPRPFKPGAYKFAVAANVPVQPVFITMNDSDKIGADGFAIQEYTVNVFPAIYPDKNLSNKENEFMMSKKNYEYWVECYEKFYNEKLKFNIQEK